MSEPSLSQRVADLVQETLTRNTDTMIARYYAEHPGVAINDVVLFLDSTQPPAMMFRVERRSVLDELIELRNKVSKLELSLMSAGPESGKA